MILGAMVAAGVDQETLKQQLSLLDVSGYNIDFEIVDRSGISATHARVQTKHEHAHRHLRDILKIIDDSRLSDGVKVRAAKIFSRLGEAEALVHNVPIEKVHFHEVGALDAIIDVVGAAICFELLQIERFVSSPLHVGSGSCGDGTRTFSGSAACSDGIAERRAVLLDGHCRRTADANRRSNNHHRM